MGPFHAHFTRIGHSGTEFCGRSIKMGIFAPIMRRYWQCVEENSVDWARACLLTLTNVTEARPLGRDALFWGPNGSVALALIEYTANCGPAYGRDERRKCCASAITFYLSPEMRTAGFARFPCRFSMYMDLWPPRWWEPLPSWGWPAPTPV